MTLVPFVLRLLAHRRRTTNCRQWILVEKLTVRIAVFVLQLQQLVSSLEVLVAWLSFETLSERSPARPLVIILSLVAIEVHRGVGFGKGGHRETHSVDATETNATDNKLPASQTIPYSFRLESLNISPFSFSLSLPAIFSVSIGLSISVLSPDWLEWRPDEQESQGNEGCNLPCS